MPCPHRISSASDPRHDAESSGTSCNPAKAVVTIPFCLSIGNLFLFLLLTFFSFTLFAVELEISPAISSSGTFSLSWHGEEGERYRLFQIDERNRTTLIYQGVDSARVMTGLPNGEYIYQVEGEFGRSEPRKVTVAHHSLLRAFTFFSIGLVVFIATVILVVRGNRER